MGGWRHWKSAALALFLTLCVAGGAGAAGVQPVRIGIVPSESVKVLAERYQPLMEYLSRSVGRPFELHPSKSYEEIVAKLSKGQIDGGVFGSYLAHRALREIAAVPLARPEKGGVSTYYGYVVVRKDSGIAKIEDLKGKSFDYVSRGTSAGYVFPRALLAQRGIDPEAFFSRTTTAGRHDIALAKVLNRESDGAAVKDLVYERLASTDPRVKSELAVIHKSGPFPDDTVLFRRETPPDLLNAVRRALLSMEKDPGGRPALAAIGVDRYIRTDAKDFAFLEKLLNDLGSR